MTNRNPEIDKLYDNRSLANGCAFAINRKYPKRTSAAKISNSFHSQKQKAPPVRRRVLERNEQEMSKLKQGFVKIPGTHPGVVNSTSPNGLLFLEYTRTCQLWNRGEQFCSIYPKISTLPSTKRRPWLSTKNLRIENLFWWSLFVNKGSRIPIPHSLPYSAISKDIFSFSASSYLT